VDTDIDFDPLSFFFPLREAPLRYISHLVGHEGPGSLLENLKRQSLANALSSYSSFETEFSTFFTISIDLTEEGLGNLRYYYYYITIALLVLIGTSIRCCYCCYYNCADKIREIKAMVFNYMRLIREADFPEWIFEEVSYRTLLSLCFMSDIIYE